MSTPAPSPGRIVLVRLRKNLRLVGIVQAVLADSKIEALVLSSGHQKVSTQSFAVVNEYLRDEVLDRLNCAGVTRCLAIGEVLVGLPPVDPDDESDSPGWFWPPRVEGSR